MGQSNTNMSLGINDGIISPTNEFKKDEKGCSIVDAPMYPSSLGISIAVPEWEAICTAILLTCIIISTVVGNFLVIVSVFTYKPLRIVQNFFIVSLAFADLTVALLVLPFNVAYSILGKWIFGIYVCKLWLTCDIMCCTSSILNLCAIAIDRYWAITDPINYAQKRTLQRVLVMIGIVWTLSLIISSPPLLGWNDWPSKFESDTPCRLTSEPGFVVFSASGSFYIPLIIMTIVYFEIYLATRKRLRNRAQATKISTISFGQNKSQRKGKDTNDQDSASSDANRNNQQGGSRLMTENENKKSNRSKKKQTRRYWNKGDKTQNRQAVPILTNDQSIAEQVENNENRNTSSDSNSKDIAEAEDIRVVETTPVSARARTIQRKRQNPVYQFIEEKQRISLTRERRAARTLGIIMGVFIICWLPFFIIYLVTPFCNNCCLSGKFINFITWLGYLNSALNPLIYTIFNMDFRRAFKRLLCIKR